MNRRLFLLAPVFALPAARAAAGMRLVTIHEEFGNKPQTFALTPAALPLMNLPHRTFLRHFDGFGQQDHQFFYKGGPAMVADALRLFAGLPADARTVRLSAREGVTYTHGEKRQPHGYEVCFRDLSRYQEPKTKSVELTIHLTAAAVPAADPAAVRAMVADLDSPRYPVRAAADRALAKLGRAARPTLRREREAATSPEVRSRIDGLLAKLTGLALDDFTLPAGLAVHPDFPPDDADRKPLHAEIERFVAGR